MNDQTVPSRWARNLGLAKCLWVRDMMRLKRQRSRWLGVVLQPLLFWWLIGSGLSNSVQLTAAPELSYLEFFFPGVLVMVVLFTTLFASMSLIEDRQSGFLRAIIVAPGSRLAIVLGKVAGVGTMALIQATLLLAILPFSGLAVSNIDWLGLGLALTMGATALAALSLSVAWVLRSTQAYHAIMSVVLIPLWVISGAMFPLEAGWLRVVAIVNPIAWLVSAVRGAFGDPTLHWGWNTHIWLAGLFVFAVAGVGLALAMMRRSERGDV